MCIVRLISDLHLGHKGMADYRRFQDEFYHDEFIIDSWNNTVRSKKDLTYVLGDITMETSKHYHLLDRLMGRKIVVLGNHDRPQDVVELLKHVDHVCGIMPYKGYILSHAPLHPSEIGKYRANIHGHIHKGLILTHPSVATYLGEVDNKYVNVCAENIKYKPKTLDEIFMEIQQRRLKE